MKKTRKYRRKRKIRGGNDSTEKKLSPGASVVKTISTIIMYGLSAVLVGPIYILAELLNIPMNSLNNLSRKAFEDNKEDFLHVPIHKMVVGCPIKKMDPNNFALQNDMYIHKNVAVVSCDKKGDNNDDVPDYGTTYSDSFSDFFGILSRDKKLRHHVFRLFQYIENIREPDEERKVHIQKIISKISDYKVLVKCYLIYNSLASICPKIKEKSKTLLKDEDVVNIVNPYAITGSVSYTKKLGCVYKHLTKKKFDAQDVEDCKPTCNTCTFRTSLSRLSGRYASMFSSSGCRVSIVKKMINTYYSHLTVKLQENLPVDETGVISYLDRIKVLSNLHGIVDEKIVLEKFNTFICKYDIMSVLQKQIEVKIKEKLEAGYPMKSILQFIQQDNSRKE